MNLERLAILFVRLIGLSFLISALASATQLPYDQAVIQLAIRNHTQHVTADAYLQGTLSRTLLYVVFGAIFLVGYRQIIRVLTAGLTLTQKTE